MDIDGVVVVDKPSGPTSFDLVRQVKRALGTSRVGHTGTLDPMASGVLVVCVGWSTRLVPFLSLGTKTYDATMCLGITTDTDDAEGAVVALADASGVTDAALEDALARFRGTFAQVPPQHSAVKVDGVRAYDLARAGHEPDLHARPATVSRLDVTLRMGASVSFTCEVSHGTYVRSLARDVGRLLGVGAHLTALRRTRNEPFGLDVATPIEEGLRGRLVTPWDALAHFPGLALTPVDEARWRDGCAVPAVTGAPLGGYVRVRAAMSTALRGVGVQGASHVTPARVRPGSWSG